MAVPYFETPTCVMVPIAVQAPRAARVHLLAPCLCVNSAAMDHAGSAFTAAPVEYKPPTTSWPADEPAPRYYDHTETYPFLGPALLPHLDEIVDEMKVRSLSRGRVRHRAAVRLVGAGVRVPASSSGSLAAQTASAVLVP